jgi:predicted ArsR family transcriptional regulator
MTHHRSRPEGRAHRAVLRARVLPLLAPGAMLPSTGDLARLLRISDSEAWRHLRRVLAEDGIATETRGAGRGRRVFVVQNWRLAA